MPRVSGQNLEALLVLNRTPGLRTRSLSAFFEEGLTPSEIVERIKQGEKLSWKESLEATQRIFNPVEEMEKADSLSVKILSFLDDSYPSLLKESSDPPLVLYVKGDILDSDQAAIAIVGSRHPSLYGLEQARRFAKRLAQLGLTVVSGFARGIDRASHEAALEISYGRTLAVLGSGLDVIYPKEHQTLREEVSERGALISEFSFGTPPLAENFPKRNRIIAGFALGVLVVEAHSRSGSLITANLAAEEGREVFALPGRVDQLGSRGTHHLIKEGASLVESPDEIFDALSPQLWPYVSVNQPSHLLSEEEKEFLGLFVKSNLTPDEAIREGSLSPSSVRALLTQLELKGAIKRRLDGRYERVFSACEKI
ncbi:MAG: DNA-protecting protein DprA [Candidatus Omnitrophica bacterium]|nr:DNA-protecting protein DprA [Candidatus Omnitrophota bacterium]